MKKTLKSVPSRSHEQATVESFRKDPEFAAEYLNSVLEDGDQEEFKGGSASNGNAAHRPSIAKARRIRRESASCPPTPSLVNSLPICNAAT